MLSAAAADALAEARAESRPAESADATGGTLPARHDLIHPGPFHATIAKNNTSWMTNIGRRRGAVVPDFAAGMNPPATLPGNGADAALLARCRCAALVASCNRLIGAALC
jgi:hypothetical protein